MERLPRSARGVGRVGFGADALADRVDLDHVGAEIAQHHRAERARERGAEVEHADPVEGMRARRAFGRALTIGRDVGERGEDGGGVLARCGWR